MPSLEQIRAARALLGWSQHDLAERADLSQTGIARIENGTNQPNAKTMQKIEAAFEQADIEFLGASGLRKRSGEIRTLRGVEGFKAFMNDVYETVKQVGGDISVYNVNEDNWLKWMGKEAYEAHALRMKAIEEKYKFRIIIKEGDTNFIANEFAEYRWFPKELYNDQSFYAYGKKLALLNFKEDSVEVLILNHNDFTAGFRVLFDIAWNDVAKKP